MAKGYVFFFYSELAVYGGKYDDLMSRYLLCVLGINFFEVEVQPLLPCSAHVFLKLCRAVNSPKRFSVESNPALYILKRTSMHQIKIGYSPLVSKFI